MKILEIIYRFYPSVGGSQKVVYELSKEFVKKGHDVTVVTSTSMTNNDTRGFSTGRRFTFKSLNDRSYKETKEGINIYRFKPFFQLFPYGYNPQMKKYLKKYIKEFDIVHVHGYQTYEADMVSRLSKNYILTAHDIIAHYGGILGFLKKIFDIIIGKRILKRAKYLVALTAENIKQYKDIVDCGDKIKLIPDGIEPLEKSEKSSELMERFGNPKKVVLFVGRVVKYKGAQDIIKAANSILKFEPSTKFVFVGEDQGYMDELKKLAKELNVSDKCIFEGKVSCKIDCYYNTADVFVLPSRGEGFGLTAVEAMSVGVPSILADLGGLKHVLKMVGGYSLDMDHDVSKQIADHVIEIFKDDEIDSKMKNVIENTKRLTWDNISNETLELFKQIKGTKK
jgi:glycosyltransferase involved in cell wall biosynthesis